VIAQQESPMTVAETRATMETYLDALLGGGAYESYFADAIVVTLTGSGKATMLGRSTNDGFVQILGPAPAGSCDGGRAAVNTETLTAANGDTLALVVYDDVSCPTDSSGLRFHGTGHWRVTGGTGRFTGATGQGSFDGHGDFVQGVFRFSLTGTISAPSED
jgi:hypothetical protein